jgi:glutathione S-transferase
MFTSGQARKEIRMIKLYGVQLSAYYNKVKIALLEKGVNFQEVPTRPSQEPAMLEQSPMGKIPYVDINGHALSESTVILEWLEDAYPTAALLPPTPNGRASARELMTMLDLYLMPAVGPLYRHLLFGAALDEAAKASARRPSSAACWLYRAWCSTARGWLVSISALPIFPPPVCCRWWPRPPAKSTAKT